MKILIYHIRDDEIPYIKKWIENHPDVEVKYIPDLVSVESAEFAKGYDAITAFQAKPFSRDIFDALTKVGIKNLSLRSKGVDNVDFEAAKELGVRITNVPIYALGAVSEHTITLILRLLRHSLEFDRRAEKRNFNISPLIAKDLNSQTVGVLGTGNIGKVVVKLLQGFGAKVIAHDIIHSPEIEKQGLYVKDLNELVEKSTVLTIHIPGSPENKHLINKEILHKAPEGVFIVNTARGNIIDTDALIEALDEGKVAGAALDVYEAEAGVFSQDFQGKETPDKRFENLLKRDNVIITPHVAFYTENAVSDIIQVSLDSSVALIKGETPSTIVTQHHLKFQNQI